METLKFPLYAENINHETYVETDYNTSFVIERKANDNNIQN